MSKVYCSPLTNPTCPSILQLLWHFRRLPVLVLRGVSTFESNARFSSAKCWQGCLSIPNCGPCALSNVCHWLKTFGAESNGIDWLLMWPTVSFDWSNGPFWEQQPKDQHMSISTTVCNFVCKLYKQNVSIDLTEYTKYPHVNLQIIIKNIVQIKITVNSRCLYNQHDIKHSHKNDTKSQFSTISLIKISAV